MKTSEIQYTPRQAKEVDKLRARIQLRLTKKTLNAMKKIKRENKMSVGRQVEKLYNKYWEELNN